MSNFIKAIQTYLLYASPFVLGCAIWSSLKKESEILGGGSLFIRVLWEALSWNLMLWFLMLVVFLVCLVTMPSVREKTLKKLGNIRERDEREEYVTGRASRSTYISSISVLILFLFFTVFSVNVYRLPETEQVDGHTKKVTIDLSFEIFDTPAIDDSTKDHILFASSGFGLSKSAIIFVLLAWQILSFNVVARRELLHNS